VLSWGQLSPERRDAAEQEAREFLSTKGHPGVDVRNDCKG